MASTTKKRNGTLEFMRFVFCMTILFYHIGKYTYGSPPLNKGVFIALFPHGAMGVEFFFLLTGVFLAASLDKQLQRAEKKTNVFADTGKYLWKKYLSVFPQHLVAFAVLFGVMVLIHLDMPNWSAGDRFLTAISNLLLLQMTGWMGSPLNHIEWYLSAMLIAILIVYFLCHLHFKVVTRYIAPVASVGLLIWMCCEFPSLTGVTRPMVVCPGFSIYKGDIRAFAEILLGTFAYSLGKYALAPLSDRIGKPVRFVLTVLEWVMYGGAITITLLTLPYGWEYGALAFIFGGVLLSFSGLTCSGSLFDNNVSYFLGKITLPIYLSQLSAIYAVNYYLKDYDNGMKTWAIIVLTVISSAITMFAGDALFGLFAKKRKDSVPKAA